MAIRIKYGIGAGIIGAFASGQAAGQRRRQKYMMGLMAQQQQHRNRMEELDFRAGGRLRGAGRGRLGGGGQAGGRWIDPLVDTDQFAPFGATEQGMREYGVEQGAQARAAARKGRLGQGYTGDLLPRFQSQEEIEQAQELDDVAQEREFKQGMQQRGFDQDAEMQQRRFGEAGDKAAVGRYTAFVKEDVGQGRQQLEDDRFPEGSRQKVRELLDKIEAVVGEKKIGDDAVRAEKLEPLLDELEGYRAQMTDPLTDQDEIKKQLGPDVFDTLTKQGVPLVLDAKGRVGVLPGFKPEDLPGAKAAAKAAEQREGDIDRAAEALQKGKAGTDDTFAGIDTAQKASDFVAQENKVKAQLGKIHDARSGWGQQEHLRHGVPAPPTSPAGGQADAATSNFVITPSMKGWKGQSLEEDFGLTPQGEPQPVTGRGDAAVGQAVGGAFGGQIGRALDRAARGKPIFSQGAPQGVPLPELPKAEMPGGKSNPIPIRGPADYATVKPGQHFVAPDGTIRRKRE